jgi:putative protein-disulfide isomerase
MTFDRCEASDRQQVAFLCRMIRFALLLFLLLQMTATAQPKDTILYVYDPMCGWCYGFDPVMEQVGNEWGDRFQFHVVSGGMITGDRQGIIAPHMAQYILNTVPRLEKMTGMKFGDTFLAALRNGTYYASSVRPSRAMVVFRGMRPDSAIAFAHAMQKELFLHGRGLEDDATYIGLCGSLGLDGEAFIKALNDTASLVAAEENFALSARLGVSGFPAVIGVRDGKATVLTNGYTDHGQLTTALNRFLKQGR